MSLTDWKAIILRALHAFLVSCPVVLMAVLFGGYDVAVSIGVMTLMTSIAYSRLFGKNQILLYSVIVVLLPPLLYLGTLFLGSFLSDAAYVQFHGRMILWVLIGLYARYSFPLSVFFLYFIEKKAS